jgi:hypothetical protein
MVSAMSAMTVFRVHAHFNQTHFEKIPNINCVTLSQLTLFSEFHIPNREVKHVNLEYKYVHYNQTDTLSPVLTLWFGRRMAKRPSPGIRWGVESGI